ncbi:hypothetical protein BJV82DRAFT_300455 [Fennellomyces sp. T-0311]|nr:hypothetical protein BJV82DRAFT_300455 [Fennellomyces sp. T-0311]
MDVCLPKNKILPFASMLAACSWRPAETLRMSCARERGGEASQYAFRVPEMKDPIRSDSKNNGLPGQGQSNGFYRQGYMHLIPKMDIYRSASSVLIIESLFLARGITGIRCWTRKDGGGVGASQDEERNGRSVAVHAYRDARTAKGSKREREQFIKKTRALAVENNMMSCARLKIA